MDKGPECETGNHQNPRGEAGKNLFDLSHSSFLLDMFPKGRELKAENELLGPHQDKKLLHCKGNKQQIFKNLKRSQKTNYIKLLILEH